jgi:AcrR family transcriptional regulator
VTARPRLPAAERRDQLLDVARGLVLSEGFKGISIEAVARAAGITRPIVYGHFGDLPGLLDALLRRESERALAQLAAVLPTDLAGNPREQLLAGLRGYLAAVEAAPETWRLLLVPPEGAPAALRDGLARGREAVLGHLADAARPGIGSGGASPDPELTARTLSAIADECARLLLTDPDRYPVDRLAAHADWVLGQLA